MATEIIGAVSSHIETLLGIQVPVDRNIYISDSNWNHMKTSHPADFLTYGHELKNILSAPDYVGQNPSDESIEFVKEFCVNHEYVKVAVRLSKSDRYFARSLYVLNHNRVKNFIAKGTLKKT